MGWTCLNMLLLNWTTATKNNNTSIWTPRHSSWCRLFCITHCQHGGSNQSHPATVRVEFSGNAKLCANAWRCWIAWSVPARLGKYSTISTQLIYLCLKGHRVWITPIKDPTGHMHLPHCKCRIKGIFVWGRWLANCGHMIHMGWSCWSVPTQSMGFWDFWMSYEILWVLFILSITFGTCIWHCSKPHHNAISEIYSFSKSPLPHCFHWVGWQNMLGGPRMVGLTEGWWEI